MRKMRSVLMMLVFGLCATACATDDGDESPVLEGDEMGEAVEGEDIPVTEADIAEYPLTEERNFYGAHWLRHPSDPSYGYVKNPIHIQACDLHIDGHRVRAWYDFHHAPTKYFQTVWAPSQGCTPDRIVATPIRTARICVEYEGCGPFYSSPG